VRRLDGAHLPHGIAMGWATPLAHIGYTVVLLSPEEPPASTQSLIVNALTDLATLERRAGEATAQIHASTS
jgi:hypothetical protein